MDFGFSPGDIVLLTKFTWKVISALKESGSKLEFRQAQAQCEAFLSLMDEFQRLDLSSAPDVFRQKIREHSANATNIIDEFKKSIAAYEKSMGKTSTQGRLRSAGRKVQWALMAAEDVKRFNVALESQLTLIKLAINFSLASFLDKRFQGPATSDNLLSNGGTSSSMELVPYQSPHTPAFSSDYELFRQLDGLRNMVYSRFLAGPNIHSPGRVHTLPEGSAMSSNSLSLQLEDAVAIPGQFSILRPRQEGSEGGGELVPHTMATGANPHDGNSFADNIDEWLVSFNLRQLSTQERMQLEQNGPIRPYTGSRPSSPTPRTPQNQGSTGPAHMNHNSSSSSNTQYAHNDTRRPSSFGLDPFSVAAYVLEAVTTGVQLSMMLRRLSLLTNGKWKEISFLARRLGQHMELLASASGVINAMAFDDELHQLGISILLENINLMKDGKYLLNRVDWAESRLWGSFAWFVFKKDILHTLEQVEPSKSSLGVMLQLYQAKMAERQSQSRKPLVPPLMGIQSS